MSEFKLLTFEFVVIFGSCFAAGVITTLVIHRSRKKKRKQLESDELHDNL